MRSQLLISVEHLPTISQDIEVTAQHEKLTADVHTDTGLEDYVKSIQTLAQPSSLTDHNQYGQCRAQRRTRFRPRSSLKVCEPKVLTVAQDSYHGSLVSLQTDPLAWLYRQNGNKNQEGGETFRAALPEKIKLANTVNLHKNADTNKRLQCSKCQSIEHQSTQEKRIKYPRFQKKCRSTGYGSWGSVTKFHKPQLPVIYEL
ncbi:PREDICTED: protein DEPP [Nanorana parkeri]|uniref:protein DEPP n=1 Tax=Nanorana parkeri TaxID=125878 RepID=UPI0008549196|nr:PREDICTED: protein DEPP [Nanorana parkeri]